MFDPVFSAFEHLPDYPAPIPQSNNPNKKLIALIPVFRDPYTRGENLAVYAKSAVYSRASCLLNTDAREMGVEVKLYIQDFVDVYCADLFQANHIDMEKDVIMFRENTPRFGRGIWGRYGKKVFTYWDFNLAEYDRIVLWDSDMWFVDDKTLFQRFAELPEDVSAYARNYTQPKRAFLNRIYNFTYLNELSVDAILEIIDVEIPDDVPLSLGGFCTHPAKSFFFDRENYHFIRWLADNAPLLGCDETIMALAYLKFGKTFTSLEDILGLKFARIRDMFSYKERNPKIVHGKAPQGQDGAFVEFLSTFTRL